MTLPNRHLGTLEVSAIGLGCMNLSHAYGTPPAAADATRLLNRALDLGVTLLDTAALYGGGRNETLIAEAVGHRRDDYRLASKCVLGLRDGQRILDGSPAAITQSVDESLDRLRVDHIDLMYLHRADPVVPIEDSVGALVRARDAGKIGAIGLSEMAADTIRRAHAVHPITAVQTEYSPAVRNPEIAVLETCRTLGIGFVAFSPVARGLLAGGVRNDDYESGDLRRTMPRFTGENLRYNLAVVARFTELAASIGMTPAQLSLGWLLTKGVVPIPGTTSIAHLDENVAAVHASLPDGVVAAVEAILPPGALHGARYPRTAQAQVTTETFANEELA